MNDLIVSGLDTMHRSYASVAATTSITNEVHRDDELL